jgi:YD repeat-containing protein
VAASYLANATAQTAGNTRVEQESRTVTTTNPLDPFLFTSLTQTNVTNGRPAATGVYTRSSRTTEYTSSGGRTSSATVDTQGRLTSTQVTGLDPLTWTFDGRGRLSTQTAGPGGPARTTTIAYNADGAPNVQAPAGAGMPASVTDPLGHVLSFAYDLAGRITALTFPGGRTVGLGYDANGNVTSITPPGRDAHVFVYDDDNLVSSYTPPDPAGGAGTAAQRTTFTYDGDRKLDLVSLPGGRSIDYQYDGSGRPNAIVLGGPTTIGQTYDGQGRLSTVSRTGGPTITYGYNQSLTTSVGWSGAGQTNGSVEYSYDDDLRFSSIAVNGANAIGYIFDNDSLITKAGALTIARAMAPAAPLMTGSTLTTPSAS